MMGTNFPAVGRLGLIVTGKQPLDGRPTSGDFQQNLCSNFFTRSYKKDVLVTPIRYAESFVSCETRSSRILRPTFTNRTSNFRRTFRLDILIPMDIKYVFRDSMFAAPMLSRVSIRRFYILERRSRNERNKEVPMVRENAKLRSLKSRIKPSTPLALNIRIAGERGNLRDMLRAQTRFFFFFSFAEELEYQVTAGQ